VIRDRDREREREREREEEEEKQKGQLEKKKEHQTGWRIRLNPLRIRADIASIKCYWR